MATTVPAAYPHVMVLGRPAAPDLGVRGHQPPKAPALVGLVSRFGALFRDVGDDQFVGLEAAFRGHGGQFVTQ